MLRVRGRARPAGDYLRLKAGARELVALAGGVEAAATVCRVGTSQLSAFGSVNEADRHMPIDVAVDLELNVGQPVVTSILADLSGHRLAPHGAVALCPKVAEALAKVFGGSGVLACEYTMAIADQELDEAERAQLRQRLAQIITDATHALAGLGGRG